MLTLLPVGAKVGENCGSNGKDGAMTNGFQILFAVAGAGVSMIFVFASLIITAAFDLGMAWYSASYCTMPIFAFLGWKYAAQIDEWLNTES